MQSSAISTQCAEFPSSESLPDNRMTGESYANCWLGKTCVLLVCALFMAGCQSQPALEERIQGLVFKTLTGERIELSETSGPLLVNFWSTDCVVCIREMPDLTALYEEYRDDGFELIAVAMPYDAPNRVLELAEERELPFPVALDLDGEAVERFASVKGTPTSYLLDGNGKLVERYIGADHIDQLKRTLKKLLESG
ncbi:MAG: TlpA disulfide reductase family protein [Granulosicoccus sp.]